MGPTTHVASATGNGRPRWPAPQRAPTLVDVARAAGVSRATASRVLASNGYAAPHT
ncbi:LacI family transcriptional regulator, partial [Salinispora arenicola]|uniref:LacI family DNA-binding transcriptional regulator n=1 Tax=Salinispora arenicola TaxID=168697 RepID=UPI0016B2B140